MDLTKFGFSTSKKKKTEDHDDEKKEKKKQYETKRERNFQENWADEFTGIMHAVPLDEEGNIAVSKSTPKVMFCQTWRTRTVLCTLVLVHSERTH